MGVPISNVTRRVVFAASGIGPYSFTFEILEQTDVAVYKDDTLLTLTTDYTVTINANGTGSITLTATPTGATQIAIVGDRAIERTSDFVTGGDFFANTVNDELDSLTIFAQQNAEAVGRALTAPQTDPTSINMTLPGAAARANKYLAFDANGDPQPGDTAVEVAAIAALADEIAAVAAIDTEITTVAGIDANVTTVAGISAAVSGVAAISSAVSGVNSNSSNINAVNSNSANINTVAGISADVTTVAGIAADVTAAVSIDSGDLAAVAAVASDVTTVAGIAADVAAVENIAANVTTVAGISANVTSVAGNSTNINSVAGNSTNINTVAGLSSDIGTVVTNIVAIQGASSNATAAQAAQTAAESARDATLAAYDNFDDRYLGAKSSEPSVDNDGNALVAGALYFNSVSGVMKLYNGSAWVAAYVSGDGFLATADIGVSVQAYDADTTKNDVANTFTTNQVISASTSDAALRVTQTGAGNALLVEDSSNPDSSPFVIDSAGNTVIGNTGIVSGLTGQLFQVHTPAAISGAGVLFAGWDENQPNALNIARSQSGTVGTHAVVSSGATGSVRFVFDDGTNFVRGAAIDGAVDGTPGTNDMPGRLVFSTTADGASSPTERMRITSTGVSQFKYGVQETKVAMGANNIDLSLGNYFTYTLSGAQTLTVSNVASSGSVSAFILEVTNGGSAALTYFSGVTWAAATAPTLTAAGVDTLAFFTTDGGTTWRGFVLGLGMA